MVNKKKNEFKTKIEELKARKKKFVDTHYKNKDLYYE